MPDINIIPDFEANYLAVIKNSVGTTMFRNLFATNYGNYQDVLGDGQDSCAYFVSFVLTGLGMIKKSHATVASTQKDLEASGWALVSDHTQIIAGDVIVWEPIKIGDHINAHIGFAISPDEAISNSWKLKSPQNHQIIHSFEGKNRAITAVYRYNFEDVKK